jgi:hypothetical protein
MFLKIRELEGVWFEIAADPYQGLVLQNRLAGEAI